MKKVIIEFGVEDYEDFEKLIESLDNMIMPVGSISKAPKDWMKRLEGDGE